MGPNFVVGLHHPNLLLVLKRELLNREGNLGDGEMVVRVNVIWRGHWIMEAIVESSKMQFQGYLKSSLNLIRKPPRQKVIKLVLAEN